MTTRRPTTTSLARDLKDIFRRLEKLEADFAKQEAIVGVLDGWHKDTEFAKKLLKEFREEYPEVNNSSAINGKAWAAVLAALAALTAVVLALAK